MRQLNLSITPGITDLWVRASDDAKRDVPITAVLLDRWVLRVDNGDASSGGLNIRLRAPGYAEWTGRALMPPDDVQMELVNPETKLGVPIEMEPSALPFSKLVAHGQCFAHADGEPFTAIQTSDFNLLGRFLNGEDITPQLAQRQAIGFNLLRVWTRYDIPGIGTCTLAHNPNLYYRIPAFVSLCGHYGLCIEFTAYTGHEDWDPEHWMKLAAAVEGFSTVILELVNEADQDGNKIYGVSVGSMAFTPIAGMLCSHGSNGSEAQPVEPFWDYATFHTNGASEWQRKCGHNAMEIWAGPTLTNENTRMPDNDNDPQHAHDAAAGAALLCAGSCFHSPSGKTSSLFTEEEVTLAKAWVAGAQSVPLSCQPGAYAHRADLEGPDDLRVYQRGADDVCIVRIGV